MKKVIGLLLVAIGGFVILYLRFSNPHMTETELFLAHWFDFLVSCVVAGMGASIYSEA